MFEAIVTSLLNKFLGDFVQNLEGNQLNLGILNGNVVLTNLKLKKEALDKLNLPIDVIYGYLGRLVLQIPWTSIKTHPVTMLIEDLHLLAAPRTEQTYDAEMEEQRAYKSKISSLERIELLQSTRQSFKDNPSLELAAANKDEEKDFTSSFITKIIDNIQITIKNIHIKYEDSNNTTNSSSSTSTTSSFDFGIILESFTAVSADPSWTPTFLVNPGNAVNKLLKLRDLSVYFDSGSSQCLRGLTYEEFVLGSKKAMCAGGTTGSTNTQQTTSSSTMHQHLVKPVCGEARAIIRKKKIAGHPQNEVEVAFDKFGLSLDLLQQYQDILTLLTGMTMSTRSLPFRDIRPPPTPTPAPLAMFRFAVSCYHRSIRKRNDERCWKEVFKRRDERKLYVKLYSNTILAITASASSSSSGAAPTTSSSSTSTIPLTPIERRQLKDLEKSLSLEDLVRYRAISRTVAKKFLDSHNSAVNATTTNSTSAMMWRLLGYKDKAPPPITDEDVRNFYDVIDFRQHLNDSSAATAVAALNASTTSSLSSSSAMIVNDSEELEIKLTLNECSFVVCAGDSRSSSSSSKSTNICSLHFIKTGITFLRRSNTICFSVSLGDLVLKDNAGGGENEENSKIVAPILIQRKDRNLPSTTATSALFTLTYDSLTQDASIGADIKLVLKPLLFILNFQTIHYLKGLLLSEQAMPKIDCIKNVTAFTKALNGITKKTRASLQKSLIEHRQSKIVMDISSPVILLPEDPLCADGSVFSVELGNLLVTSVLVPPEKKAEILRNTSVLDEQHLKRLHSFLYDRLIISLTKMRITYHRSFKDHLHFVTPIGDIGFSSGFGSFGSNGFETATETKTDNDDEFYSPSSSINDGDDSSNVILEDVDLSIQMDSCIVKDGAADLAPLKVHSTLPLLSVNVCNEKIEKIMSLLSKLPGGNGGGGGGGGASSKTDKNGDAIKDKVRKDYKRKGFHDWQRRIEQVEGDGGLNGDDDNNYDNNNDNNHSHHHHHRKKEQKQQDAAEYSNPMEMEAEFRLGRVVVNFAKSENSVSEPVCSASMDDLNLSLSKRLLDQNISLLLGDISIAVAGNGDHRYQLLRRAKGVSGQERQQMLLDLKVSIVQEGHCDFITKYSGYERWVDLTICSICLSLSSRSIGILNQYFMVTLMGALGSSAAAVNSVIVDDNFVDGADASDVNIVKDTEPNLEENNLNQVPTPKKVPKSNIKMKLEEFRVDLYDLKNRKPQIRLQLSIWHILLVTGSLEGQMLLSSSIQGLDLLSLLYNEDDGDRIVGFDAQDGGALKVELSTGKGASLFDASASANTFTGSLPVGSSVVKFDVASIVMVWDEEQLLPLCDICSSCISALDIGGNGGVNGNVKTQQKQQKPKQQQKTPKNNPLDLDLRLESPIILIKGALKNHYMRISLGNLMIRGTLLSMQDCLLQLFSIEVKDIFVCQAYGDSVDGGVGGGRGERWLLEPFSVALDVKMRLEGEAASIYGRDVSIDVEPIRMTMDHPDYLHLIYLINHLSHSSALLIQRISGGSGSSSGVNGSGVSDGDGINSNNDINGNNGINGINGKINNTNHSGNAQIQQQPQSQQTQTVNELLLSLKFKLKELHFTILSSENNDALIDFSINNINVVSTSTSADGDDVLLSVQSLLIRDLEHVNDPFRDLVRISESSDGSVGDSYNSVSNSSVNNNSGSGSGSKSGSEENLNASKENAFILRQKKSALTGDVIINAELSSINVFALWHSLYHLQYFFLSGLSYLDLYVSASSPPSSGSKEPSQPVTPTPTTTTTTTTTTIFFTLHNMTLHLLDDYTSQRANTLRIKVNSLSFSNTTTPPTTTNMSMAVNDISMALYNMNGLPSSLWSSETVIESGGIILLHDCSISLRLSTDPSTLEQDLSLTLPSLLLSLSLQDILLVQGMVSGIASERERYSRLFSFCDKASTKTAKAVTATKETKTPPPPQQQQQKQKGIISFTSWRLVILDDSNPLIITPLLDVCLGDLVINVTDWSVAQRMHIVAGATVSSSCYNAKVGSWEPMLEPFDMVLEHHVEELSIKGSKGLEFLLSHDHLQRIIKFQSDFATMTKRAIRKREVMAPYVFVNETLSPLVIGTMSSDERVLLEVPPLSRRSSTFPSWTKSRSSVVGDYSSGSGSSRCSTFVHHTEEDDPTETDSISRGDRMAYISIGGGGVLNGVLNDVFHDDSTAIDGFGNNNNNNNNINININNNNNNNNNNNKKYFQVDKEDIHRLHNGLWVFVKLVDGVRKISCRETCLISNQTKDPMCIVDGLGRKVNLSPFSSCSLSSLVDPFSIKPDLGGGAGGEDGGEYLPPKEGINVLQMLPTDRSLIIRSSSRKADNLSHHALLQLTKPSPLEHPSLVDLAIVAPIVVENLLPFAVVLQLAQMSYHRDPLRRPSLRKGQLKLGPETEGVEMVHSINPFADWEISCSIAEPAPLDFRSVFPVVVRAISTDSADSTTLLLPTMCKRCNREEEDGAVQELLISLLIQRNTPSSLKLSLYLPYLLINRSGTDIEVMEDAVSTRASSVLRIPKDTKLPFSFSKAKSRKIRIRPLVMRTTMTPTPTTMWSKPFSIDAVGGNWNVSVESGGGGGKYSFACKAETGTGKFALTKVLKISSMYYVNNKLKCSLSFSDGMGNILSVPANSILPLNLPPGCDGGRVMLGFNDAFGDGISGDGDGDGDATQAANEPTTKTKTDWLQPFSIVNPGKIHIQYKHTTILEIEKLMRDGTIVVGVGETTVPPFIIRNRTLHTLIWREDGVVSGGYDDHFNSNNNNNNTINTINNNYNNYNNNNNNNNNQLVGVGEKIFCWKRTEDSPAAKQKMIILSIKEAPLKEIRIDPLRIGERKTFSIGYFSSSFHSLCITCIAEGPTIVVVVEVGSDDIDDGVGCENTENNTEEESQTKPVYTVNVMLPWVNCSFIGPNLQEFLMIHLRNVSFRRQNCYYLQKDTLQIGWLQCDNQTYDWESPIVFYPTVLSKMADEMESHPMVKIGMMRKINDPSYWKYVGVLVQEFSLDIDLLFIRNLLAFSTFNSASSGAIGGSGNGGSGVIGGSSQPTTTTTTATTTTKNKLSQSPSYKMDWWKDMGGEAGAGGGMSFYEEIVINPIKMNLTFTSRVEEEDVLSMAKEYQLNPLSTIVDALFQSISTITDAPFSFNALILNNVFRNQNELLSTIQQYYKGEALKQVHMVLGSLDLIGNPVLLLNTLGSGVTDLFWEPYQGLVSDNPSDVGKGLAKGSSKLLLKTVGGVGGFLAKISASFGRGLSVATLDKRYQRDRRIDRARNRPHHALHGLNNGIKQLYSGIWSGISGVVDKPMEGVRVGGFEGLMVGCGKGLMGFFFKPLLGIVDLTTSITEGLGSMSKWGEDGNLSFGEGNGRLTQIRFPRPIPWDRRIRRYDYEGAFGQSLYASISSPYRIQQEAFIAHLEIPEEKCVIILTVRNIILGDLAEMCTIWTIPLSNVVDVEQKNETDDGLTSHAIVLHLRNSLSSTKEIPSPSQKKSAWFSGCIIGRLKMK